MLLFHVHLLLLGQNLEPNKRNEEIFIIHEGTKVELIDKLKGWQKIKLSNGSEGWVIENQLKPL